MPRLRTVSLDEMVARDEERIALAEHGADGEACGWQVMALATAPDEEHRENGVRARSHRRRR